MTTQSRLAMRAKDLGAVRDASSRITELGARLEEQLRSEQRPDERLRMLREATNHITRTANDAIQAYRRASRGVSEELARPDGDVAAARKMRSQLAAARRDMLRVLDVARQRYPWAEDEPTDEVDAAPSP